MKTYIILISSFVKKDTRKYTRVREQFGIKVERWHHFFYHSNQRLIFQIYDHYALQGFQLKWRMLEVLQLRIAQESSVNRPLIGTALF